MTDFKQLKKERLSKYLKPSAMAYRDLCRTIRTREDGKHPDVLKTLRDEVLKLLDEEINTVTNISTPDDFEKWHNEICEKIMTIYSKDGKYEFSYGQAQKWVNMTLKNAYLLSDNLDSVYQYFHVPVDNKILRAAYEGKIKDIKIREIKPESEDKNIILNKDGANPSWSRWNCKQYIAFQEKVRILLKEKCDNEYYPMDWEFDIHNNDTEA